MKWWGLLLKIVVFKISTFHGFWQSGCLSGPADRGPKFSERFAFMPEYPTTDEGKVPLVGDREEIMGRVATAFSDMSLSTVDGIRVKYEDGWYLCRPSNTEPILVMRAEGRDQEALDSILLDVESRIGQIVDLEKLK